HDYPCSSAPVVGPCKGTFPRWYYDRNAGECKHFLYGGCQGNHNNFLQESDCVTECIQKCKTVVFFLSLNSVSIYTLNTYY
uniref:BPTI/Kunitz inhibitor domain-containing protein n=1 Tax=Neogobius melanostomus TaxID=47308 RepID=A0A8C6TQD9_9GOBI